MTPATEPDCMDVAPVDSAPDGSPLVGLLAEYHRWMAAHADGYDPDAELAADRRSLATEPGARAWVARVDGDPAGCVLLYVGPDGPAEFKRLYVRPAHREKGVGRALVRTVVDRARAAGARTLGLTTPPWSESAHALYESMGFERTGPYPGTRLPERYHDEAIFMRLDLFGDEGDDGLD
jgi:GNAT superfamily N-acetyltransferase